MTGSSQLSDSKPGSPSSLKASPDKSGSSIVPEGFKVFPYEMALSLYKGLLAETRMKISSGELLIS